MTLEFKKLNPEFEPEVLGWLESISHSQMLGDIPKLKIVTSFLFVAFVLTKPFIPFLEGFVAATSVNVCEVFWSQVMGQNFPYSITMFWITNLLQSVFYEIGFYNLLVNALMFVFRILLIVAYFEILMILCCRLLRRFGLLFPDQAVYHLHPVLVGGLAGLQTMWSCTLLIARSEPAAFMLRCILKNGERDVLLSIESRKFREKVVTT